MAPALQTIIFPVRDLARAKTLFAALLGVQPVMDEAYYAQFNASGQEIGLDPNGHSKGMTGAVGYWHVDDINDTVAQLLEAGATEVQPPSDLGGGKLMASMADGEGNMIGLIQLPA